MSDNKGHLVIKNGNVLCPDGELRVADVLLAGGQIREIGLKLQAPAQIDATAAYVLPGLIDLHTHGIGFTAVETGTLHEYAEFEAKYGATTLYPTLFTSPAESAEIMRRHRRQTNELEQLPQIAGFRLESPYIARTGAGAINHLAPITPENTELMLEGGGGHIKIWDVSPEMDGASQLIRELSRSGIVCSICHTNATIEQGRMAVEAGASLVTHMFNVFPLPQVTEGGVHPAGLVDYLLVEDRVTCEIIADGTHVPPLLVEKAFRCKTWERLAFVTDSAFGSGLPPGEYTEPNSTARFVIRDRNDGRRAVDIEMGLSGSALAPLHAFRNALNVFGKDIATASQVCSTTPARVMGLNKGQVAVGRDADLIVLDAELELLYTIVAGTIIHCN